MVTCPNQNCARDILPDADSHRDDRKDAGGLRLIRCSHCGHSGFIVGEGLLLVFRAGQEYCFTFGATPAHLIMSVTADATYACQWSGLSQEALARHAAEWLLLLGRKAGAFTLSPNHPMFVGFIRYLQDRIPKCRPQVA